MFGHDLEQLRVLNSLVQNYRSYFFHFLCLFRGDGMETMRNSSGADGNRRTVLTVPTVLTTNRATAGEQSERTAGEQCFDSGLAGSEYT